MLRITADVNGHLVGYIYIHNSGRYAEHDCLYNAAIWNPEKQDGVFGIEDIRHPRQEGWAALVSRVLRAYPIVENR